MAFKLKIAVPTKLPPTSEGISPVEFKTWKGRLIIYLRQNRECRLFLEGGIYSTWVAAKIFPDRIRALHATDAPGENDGTDAEHLMERQTQLATLLDLVGGVVDASQYEDVMQKSTGMPWIWNLIKVDYNIQKKGRHFLKIDAYSFNPAGAETPLAFYKRFRSFFTDNLRKRGERDASNENVVLTANEVMSPTLENTIVYMALKAVDARLPAKIDKLFGPRMNADVTLFDLHDEIFIDTPEIIQDLDKKESGLNNIGCENSEYAMGETLASTYLVPTYQTQIYQEPTEASSLNAFGRGQFRPRGFNNYRPRFQSFQQRPQFGSQRPAFRPRLPWQQAPRFQNTLTKFCSLCKDAGSPEHVVRSHGMNDCSRLSRSTVSQMRSMVLDDQVDPANYPETDNMVTEENYGGTGYTATDPS